MNRQQLAYAEILDKHIKNVQEAGSRIGANRVQLAIHDRSKFSDEEFEPYARYFFDDEGFKKVIRTKQEEVDFEKAWLYHLHRNEHHWQFWMIPNGFSNGAPMISTVLQMPEHFALEMLADWLGASKTYTGSWDMNKWLIENIPQITLHSKTAQLVRRGLANLGYGEMLKKVTFNI